TRAGDAEDLLFPLEVVPQNKLSVASRHGCGLPGSTQIMSQSDVQRSPGAEDGGALAAPDESSRRSLICDIKKKRYINGSCGRASRLHFLLRASVRHHGGQPDRGALPNERARQRRPRGQPGGHEERLSRRPICWSGWAGFTQKV